MKTKKSADALNALISINTSRLYKYDKATLQTDEADLQELFLNFRQKSQQWKKELISEVEILGQKPVQEPVIQALPLVKFWLKLKSKFSVKDREELLNCCEYDEDHTVKKYKEILINNVESLTTRHQNILKKQLQSIKSDHDLLKDLGELLVTYRQFNLDT